MQLNWKLNFSCLLSSWDDWKIFFPDSDWFKIPKCKKVYCTHLKRVERKAEPIKPLESVEMQNEAWRFVSIVLVYSLSPAADWRRRD